MSNKKNGSKFEKDLCQKLFDNGIWARLEYPAEDGSQPFDVKAFYRQVPYIFECKDCKNGYFDLNSVEDNQLLALDLLSNNILDCNIMFAFQFNERWLFVEASEIIYQVKYGKKKKLKEDEIASMWGVMDFKELTNWIKSKGEW